MIISIVFLSLTAENVSKNHCLVCNNKCAIILLGVRYGKISAHLVMSRFLCNLNVKR